ncbi:MAG TPA: DUF5985 family protein [Burkholderiaceae bacterium]|nr:DUF5985 family protein [Burkholderiaceae bacterium]
MGPFLLGAVAMASLVASLFFLRFWHRTRDRFFLMFAAAFLVDAASRSAMHLYAASIGEHEPLFYLARLFMFGLIIAAIVDKNVRSAGDRPARSPARPTTGR